MKLNYPFTLNVRSNQAVGLSLWAPGLSGSFLGANVLGPANVRSVLGTIPTTGMQQPGIDGGKNALVFDGSTNYITWGDSIAFRPTTQLSLTFWVKTTQAHESFMFCKWGAPGGTTTYIVQMADTSGKVTFATSTTGSTQVGRLLASTKAINDGKWHLICCTYDNVNQNIYIDGRLDSSLAATGALFNTTQPLVFGRLSDNNVTTSSFSGIAEDFRMYRYGLPAQTVAEMYDPKTRWELRYKPKFRWTPKKVTTVHTETASNTLTFSQTANLTTAKNASNTLTFSQTVNRTVDESTSNTLVFSQIATNPAFEAVENTLTFSQSLAIQIKESEQLTQSLTFDQTVYGFVPNQRSIQTLSLVSHVDVNTILARSSSQTLVFAEVAEAEVLNVTSSTLTFVDEADVDVSTGANTGFTITQSADINLTPHNDFTSSVITFSGAVTKSAIYARTIAQTLTFAQTPISHISKDALASTLFVITQQADGYKVTFAADTLIFSQTTVINKVIPLTVTDLLSFQQALDRTTTLNLSPTSTLVFQHTYLRPTMLGGVFQLTPIPEVIVTKTINRVSFRTKDRAIILRPPLLNDSEAGNGKIVLQRTITGGTYVYARRVTTRSLKYTFETDSFKAFEMRRFMLDCLSEPIWLENWKGEIWVGYFVNNPVSFTTRGTALPKSDWYSFDVEFEGERIH